MKLLVRAQFGVLLLTAAGSAYAAQNLPGLQVDPALLGGSSSSPKAQPGSEPAPAATTATPAREEVTPPPQTSGETPATKAGEPVAEKKAPASPGKRPSKSVAKANVPAAQQDTPTAPTEDAPQAPIAEAPRRAAPAVVAATPVAVQASPPPAVEAPRAEAVRPTTTQASAPQSTAPPKSTASKPALLSADSLPPLQVDPALLGGPSTLRPAPLANGEQMPLFVETPRTAAKVQSSTSGATARTLKTTARRGSAADTSSAETTASALEEQTPPQVGDAPVLPARYSAYVKAGLLPEPVLKSAPRLNPIPLDPKASYPVFIAAERIDGRNEAEVVAQGDAEMRKAGSVLTSDRLTYWQVEDEVEAVGNVKLMREHETITGPKLRMQLDESVGFFDQPNYIIKHQGTVSSLKSGISMPDLYAAEAKPAREDFSKFGFTGKLVAAESAVPDAGLISAILQPKLTTGSGHAERINFEGEGQYHLTNATYSTCPVGGSGSAPSWHIELADLKLDYEREMATGSEGKIVFKGVPILYSPWMDFSLNNQRKSGLLAPHFGTNSVNGFEFEQPWYWNIAPNMDATISPREMTKRGLQLNTEVRYLDPNYSGQARVEYLPNDQIYGESRKAYSLLHNQSFGYGFSGSLNLNGVSDDRYFTDLSTKVSEVSQSNLLREGSLNYSASWWSANLTAQRYQVLQDPNSSTTVATPYSRLPQIGVTGTRADLPAGLTFSGVGEYVKFSHPTQVIGQRTMLNPQLSLPLQSAAYYVTPKLGLNVTRYSLEQQAVGTPDQLTRNVPTFSLDSGVTFERPVDWLGKNLTQTLEPRLYYLYVPYRDQSKIPVFDSGLADFNFAQIFSENRYSGNDRIGDANQLTAALTSRLIDPNTGAELVRGMLGQRFYFSDQRVTLPDEVARTRTSADYLAALSGQIYPRTFLDTAVQYNPNESRMERLNVGMRYQPETSKVVSAGYRYTRDLLGQIDVSGQWPLGGRWNGVGRYNYSTKEHRIIESLAGLEYNADCWTVRGVIHRLATTAQTQTTSFFIQLELSGFSNIGSNPFEVLRRNVPGYNKVNQSGADQSNFSGMY